MCLKWSPYLVLGSDKSTLKKNVAFESHNWVPLVRKSSRAPRVTSALPLGMTPRYYGVCEQRSVAPHLRRTTLATPYSPRWCCLTPPHLQKLRFNQLFNRWSVRLPSLNWPSWTIGWARPRTTYLQRKYLWHNMLCVSKTLWVESWAENNVGILRKNRFLGQKPDLSIRTVHTLPTPPPQDVNTKHFQENDPVSGHIY